MWGGPQPLITVQQVLENVVGGIADVGLRIDDEPRFTCEPPRRSLRGGRCTTGPLRRQFSAARGTADTFAREAGIKAHSPSRSLLFEFVGPRVAHDLQRPEAMTGRGPRHRRRNRSGDDVVLFRLGPPRQRSSRKHRSSSKAVESSNSSSACSRTTPAPSHSAAPQLRAPPRGAATRPSARAPPVGGADRRDPCRLTAGLKRLPCGQRPATLQLPDELRQPFEPRVTAITLHRDDEVPGQRPRIHHRILPQEPLRSQVVDVRVVPAARSRAANWVAMSR